MNDLCVDLGYKSLNKFGEQLCGDMIQVVKDDDTTILVLADGLGSGVKANILSTLTSKIISTMIAAHMGIEECVNTIMSTLPVCKVRGIAYSTFTIIKITNNTYAEIIQYDNPLVILLRNGKKYDYPTQTKIISGKKIVESKIRLNCDDVFVVMSDGAIYAGVGQTLNYGWQRENIIEFIESHYDKSLSANALTSLLIDTCNNLYANMPGDDTTIAAIKIRKRQVVNLMFGPPQNPEDVHNMMSLFFAKQGRHIVCGGTTSTLAAKFLGKELETTIDYIDPRIPPIARIEGVDLVTEGVLTISRVLEYAKDYIGKNILYNEWHSKNDGASIIARMLFEEATDINFYVGKAINPAHQNPNLPIGFNIKMQLVEELSKILKQMGKTINLSYF
ncbi:MAG TPA: serine/threonine protein phosphatase [Hungateiclostridium thermocellum]|uniref:Stage II sporulation protein E n=1 Tax=Acetivibrio thermocellus (strain ATCC 27405 / DSM 1237 / JCM 9322 / NBRC 103400 / NCIMB 10682 / NRRL B-4536 / VPI 7372) TaxID=203119 RepID=A3DCI6_ACET2|nr:SpoIIE family protein phosphatase [Acetivibrio thermocellus]ABN51665.1 Stage II sporulation protein E [Acetivibrio thermocellus ATCC 27405]HBW27054.1 serine/threonine protein phosphatase [Acetivibrio thermocellus]